MKKIDFSQIVAGVRGQPFKKGTWQLLQESYQEVFDAICQNKFLDKTKVNVLFGCVNSTPGTGTFTISDGAVYVNGEVYLVDGQTLTPGGGQTVIINLSSTNFTDPTADPTKMTDGTNKNVHIIRKGLLANGATGSGTLTGDANSDFNNFVHEQWNVVGAAGQPPFEHSWVQHNSGTETDCRFRIEGRFLALGGVVVGGASNTTVFTTPVGYRPLKTCIFPIGSDFTKGYGFINNVGQLNIVYTAGSFYSLEGVRIPLD